MNDDSLMELVKAYKSMTLDERLLVIPKIIEEIGPSLRLYAFTLTSDSSAALDIYQETLISIFSSLNTFKGDTRGQLFSWCRRIARNRAADEYRENNLIKFDPLPLDEFSGVYQI